ncbi:MAG: vWA domain-containing protein, partial [Kofleriaceae bacterium]
GGRASVRAMPIRQRIVSYGIPTAAAATILAAASLTPWAGQRGKAVSVEPAASQPIDVVFAVDTTGSMAEEIDAAKRTIFAIANTIRGTQKHADLRIGLVAYRDSDADSQYITRPFALTRDLDAVYAELASYTAGGGDDFPELVSVALLDAMNMEWRSNARKLVFLVGDATAAVRPEVPAWETVAQQARKRGLIINTVRSETERVQDRIAAEQTFQEIARITGGDYSSIAKDGGVQQIATPYDQQLAELSDTVDRTTVITGTDGARAVWGKKMEAASAAPAPSKADRAGYYGDTARDEGDLVGGIAAGHASADSVDPASLPADLRDKTKGELKAELDRRVATRRQAQQEIEKLTKQREAYLSKHGKGDGFDAKVKATVEKQLKR